MKRRLNRKTQSDLRLFEQLHFRPDGSARQRLEVNKHGHKVELDLAEVEELISVARRWLDRVNEENALLIKPEPPSAGRVGSIEI